MKPLLPAIVVILALGTSAASSETEVIGEAQFDLIGERADTFTGETNLGNLIADVIRREVDADIAIHHGGGIGGSINKGPITRACILRALPFGHRIVVLELTGRVIREAIEGGIGQYPSPFGGFPQVSGMSFIFNPARPSGERLIEITIGEESLKPDKVYTVATNDFLSTGGYGWTILREKAVRVHRTDIFIHDALLTYIIRKVEEWREPVRFAVIADPHISIIPPDWPEGVFFPYAGDPIYRKSVELFLEAVKKVNAIPMLDFVLVAGDLTIDSERYNHEKLLEMLPKINAPTYVVGGNHDTVAFALECFWTGVPLINPEADLVGYDEVPMLYADYWGPGEMPFYSVEVVPGIRLIALYAYPYHHCPDERFFRWEVGEEQRVWLRGELKGARDNSEFVIVMLHQPIVSHNIPVWDKEDFPLLWGVGGHGFGVEDKLKVNSILEEFNVPLVLSGHFHLQDIMKRNNVWHITTGAPVTYPLVGARFFELDRERGLLHITTHHIDHIPARPDIAEYAREALLEVVEKKIEMLEFPSILEPVREAALLAIRTEPGVLFWRRRGAEGSVFDDDPVAGIEDPQVAWLLERFLTVTENVAVNMPEDDNAILPVRVTGVKVRPQVEGRIRTGELPPIYLIGADITLGEKLSFGYLDAGRDAKKPDGRFYLDRFVLKPEITFANHGVSLMAELGFNEDEARVDKFMVYFDELPLEPQIDEIRRIIQLAAGWEFEVNSLISLGLDDRGAAPRRKGAVPSFLETAIWEGEAARVALENRVAFLALGISVGEGLQLGTRGVGVDNQFGMLYDARNAGKKDGHPEWGIDLGIEYRGLQITRFGFWGELSNADIGVLTRELHGYASSYRSMRRHGTRAVFTRNGLTLKGESAWMRDGVLERDSLLFSAAYEIEMWHSLTPFLRYETLEVEWPKLPANPASWDRERLALGLIAGVGENINLIVEHHRNDETTGGGSIANNEFLTQLVFEF
ncbi:MAG: Trifunctional nucleotide phosphoesterase protein YfkN [Syntrophomonadaceae bacterium]|nr:Trifunctional nucleotide phosphoesterase protein YfkN [Bacillota bacterium]